MCWWFWEIRKVTEQIKFVWCPTPGPGRDHFQQISFTSYQSSCIIRTNTVSTLKQKQKCLGIFKTSLELISLNEKGCVIVMRATCHCFWQSYGPTSNTIWWHKYGSSLAQVMAYCLEAPSHYLNQVLNFWHSEGSIRVFGILKAQLTHCGLILPHGNIR